MKVNQIIVLFALLGCSSPSGWTADSKLWEDESCSFQKKDPKLSPEELVQEFLKRDSRGDFLKNEPWLDSVTLCPGHLPGPDAFTVISQYKVGKVTVTKETATVQVTYDVVGTLSSGGTQGELNAFVPIKERSKTKNFVMERTPFGWRLKDFPWEMVQVDAAKNLAAARGWVPGDKEKFDAAIADRRK